MKSLESFFWLLLLFLRDDINKSRWSYFLIGFSSLLFFWFVFGLSPLSMVTPLPSPLTSLHSGLITVMAAAAPGAPHL